MVQDGSSAMGFLEPFVALEPGAAVRDREQQLALAHGRAARASAGVTPSLASRTWGPDDIVRPKYAGVSVQSCFPYCDLFTVCLCLFVCPYWLEWCTAGGTSEPEGDDDGDRAIKL